MCCQDAWIGINLGDPACNFRRFHRFGPNEGLLLRGIVASLDLCSQSAQIKQIWYGCWGMNLSWGCKQKVTCSISSIGMNPIGFQILKVLLYIRKYIWIFVYMHSKQNSPCSELVKATAIMSPKSHNCCFCLDDIFKNKAEKKYFTWYRIKFYKFVDVFSMILYNEVEEL